MKKELRKQYSWFQGLSVCHKVYVVYWLLSFFFLFVTCTPMWLYMLIVANFGNSVRLLKRVPIDLED